MSIVTLTGDKATTTTLEIAQGTGQDHASVIKLVRNYQSDLEEFGRVGFEIQPFETAGGIQQREFATLNEHQATLILTYMRNSEIVRKFKKRLVTEFFKFSEKRLDARHNKKIARSAAASTNKVMAAMLQEVRTALGKITLPHHYMTEAKLVNWAHSGQFSKLDRDGLDIAELELLAFLELKNATLQGRKVPYAERKPLLKQYAIDWRMEKIVPDLPPPIKQVRA